MLSAGEAKKLTEDAKNEYAKSVEKTVNEILLKIEGYIKNAAVTRQSFTYFQFTENERICIENIRLKLLELKYKVDYSASTKTITIYWE